jgi:hypothetical protein
MLPERWQRLKASFLDLVERDSEARESALSSIAARDPSLAIEVRDLLSGYDAATTRLLAAPLIPPHLEEARSDLVGTRLGRVWNSYLRSGWHLSERAEWVAPLRARPREEVREKRCQRPRERARNEAPIGLGAPARSRSCRV